jgi:hypothetical protein
MVASLGVQEAHLVRIGGTHRMLLGSALLSRYLVDSSRHREASASSELRAGDLRLVSLRCSRLSMSATQRFSSARLMRAGISTTTVSPSR